MDIAQVPASRGKAWFSQGWALYKKAPLPFTVMGLIALCLQLMGSFNPMLQVVVCLLSPVLLSGLFWGAQRAERGESVDIGLIFQGFREKTAPLLKLGAIMLGFLGMIVLVLIVTIAPAMLDAIAQTGMTPGDMEQPMTQEEAIILLSSISWGVIPLVGMVVAALLTVVATLGLVFAIPLIVFHNLGASPAFGGSIKANLVDWAPIGLAGIFWLLLAIPATITFVGMLVLFPVTFLALYVAQKEIFPTPPSATT
ncbi:MAG: hypothetical protein COX57_07030 [Alphaproteobacteria bacterium CG_4_10_14_0_2_um_filter_63_37]|nr:MAG: hypothetical protein AUJ55_04315 [Proteobacteria bacterium CG1_02_64_396]PJA24746.1 MAG: hypothetical protein COX57_07030 [Alphaproteobacteria bacterium CG_4_10_14_0_2_um_filter_63_37]